MTRLLHRFVPPSKLLLGALTLAVLSGCGGGGGGGTAEPAATPASTTINGVLRDASTRQVLSGATVSLGMRDSATPMTATSGTDGGFSMRLDTSRLNTASSVILTVTVPNYRPCVVEVKDLSVLGGLRALTECADLSPVPADTFAPAEGALLYRVGDGTAGTSTESNASRLSTLPVGTSKEIRIGAVNATTAGSNLGFSLRLKIRGLEASCANRITVYHSQGTPLLTANGGVGGALVSSDTRGEFSSYDFRLATSALAPTGDLFVRLESGACGAAPADQRDDFEFYDVVGTFTPALPPT